MKKSILFLTLAFMLLSFSSTVQAQTDTTGTLGVHEHDGFFLRFLGGVGYATMSEPDLMGSDLELSGTGGIFSFQIGGVIAENLIIFGEAAGVTVSNPDLEWGNFEGEIADTKLVINGYGAGISYYIMPQNIYFSFSLLVSQTTIEFENMKGESDSGFGLNISIGKEWWVSDNWGLGAALWGHYSSMDDGEYTITNNAFGVTFSATLN